MDEEIPAPPGRAYYSYNEAYNALKEHGIRNGYGFRIKGSRPYGSNVIKTRVSFCCDKAGKYNSTARIRNTASRASSCPFKLVIYEDNSQWILRVTNDQHNHPPSLHPSAHHVYRQRTAAQKEMITALSRAGVQPKQIMTAVRQAGQSLFTLSLLLMQL
jgi:hypothetical protein